MTPSERSMPIVTAQYDETWHKWIVSLPGKITMTGATAADVEDLVAKHATGAAIRWYRVAPVTESELRAQHGDR